jgi:hypothetical protein
MAQVLIYSRWRFGIPIIIGTAGIFAGGRGRFKGITGGAMALREQEISREPVSAW